MLQVIYPLTFSLKIAGLYFNPKSECKGSKEKPSVFNPWRIYSTIVLVILWLNTGRSVIIFKDNNENLPFLLLKAVAMSWTLLTACNASVCYYACASPRCLAAFMDDMQMTSSYSTPGCVRYVRRRVWLYSIGSWVMVICNISFVAYTLYKTSNLDMMLLPFTKTMAGYNTGKL